MSGVAMSREEKLRLKAERQREYYRNTRAARLATGKLWHEKNRESKRAYDRARRLGISIEQALAMDLVTNCEATGLVLGVDPKDRAFDHNHETGVVRGVLHSKINLAIGLFGDDPAALRAAADYLERTSAPSFEWGQS